MRLLGNVEICFQKEVITEKDLKFFRGKWKGKAILPGIIHQRYTDKEVFYALTYETIPLTIANDDKNGPLVFEATLRRFPYSINGDASFANFGLRFVPKCGHVKSINLDKNWTVAINSLSASSEGLLVDFGNGSLHLEIFYKPIEHKLEEIVPSSGF